MEFVKESLFLSSLRSFLKSLFVTFGIFLAIIPIVFFLVTLGTTSSLSDKTTPIILPDLKGNKHLLPETTPAILHINFHGIIGTKDLTGATVENQLLESRQGTFKNNRIKGVLLHLNTPGGGVNDADIIYRLLVDYKKKFNVPVFAFVDGLSASGGLYISAACDKIFATPVSVIGSVGVIIGPFFNFSQTMEKIGLQSLTLTEGKDKDMLNPTRPWTPGEEESLKRLTSYFYERFVNLLTASRPFLSKEKLLSEYGAKIFDAPKAEKLGFIDNGNSDYASALSSLLQAAQIDETKPYQIVSLEPKHSFFSEFMDQKSPLITGKIKHTFQFGKNSDLSELSDIVSYLYLPPGTSLP